MAVVALAGVLLDWHLERPLSLSVTPHPGCCHVYMDPDPLHLGRLNGSIRHETSDLRLKVYGLVKMALTKEMLVPCVTVGHQEFRGQTALVNLYSMHQKRFPSLPEAVWYRALPWDLQIPSVVRHQCQAQYRELLLAETPETLNGLEMGVFRDENVRQRLTTE